ncbi:MAG: outer membrane protein assembly factor BamD, partial [Pseudomonadota bacterium]
AADAYRDFGEVVNRYPDSVYAKDARRRMVFLRNNLADSELHAARYYLDRGAYVAAANRAKTVVERYQRTPAVDDALEVMVEAYTELDMPDMAEDANRVLVLNRERGAFIEEDVSDNWLEDLWDFLQLDK